MSVASALALVRQIQIVAETPELLLAHSKDGFLDQVVSFLVCHLDHPDSRTRLGAARAFRTLSTRCGPQEWQRLDLTMAKRILQQCDKAAANGGVDADADELRSLLRAALQRPCRSSCIGSLLDNSKTLVGQHRSTEAAERGEIRLEVHGSISEGARSNVLQSVVSLDGVVSVTFEDSQVVVGTRALSAITDADLHGGICAIVQECLGEGSFVTVYSQDGRVPHVPFQTDIDFLNDDSDYDEPIYLDGSDCDDDDDEFGDDESDDGPKYLDDSAIGGDAQWNFFGAKLWLQAQRVAEYEEDPSISARLKKAKRHEEKRRHEEQARVSRLFSVLGPLQHGEE